MSSTNLNTVSYSDSHRRSYITTGAFSTEIFSYSTSMNAQFVTVGSLTAKSVPSGLNTAGIILRENGRKLYPGANPGINTYMVGVYHDTIGSGFIDPNAKVDLYYVTRKGDRQIVFQSIPQRMMDKAIAVLQTKYPQIQPSDIEMRPSSHGEYTRSLSPVGESEDYLDEK